MSVTIAFNSANLVGYYSNFRFKLSEWGGQHAMAAARTGPKEWDEICGRIRAEGYRAIEVWVALVEACADDAALAERFADTLRRHELTPVALAGPLNETTARICRRLSIPATAGAYGGTPKDTVARLMRETGILFNFENHPEKSVDELRAVIDYGANGFALALDTGWLATQGIPAPEAVRQLGRLIRHVHLKDITAAGGHETVRLGDGCVDIPGVIRELKRIGYAGVLSWEDEPESRNPFEIAAEMREYIQQQWSR